MIIGMYVLHVGILEYALIWVAFWGDYSKWESDVMVVRYDCGMYVYVNEGVMWLGMYMSCSMCVCDVIGVGVQWRIYSRA